MHFGANFRILRPEIDYGARNALLRPQSLLGQKGLHFHEKSIGFISIRGMGTQKCTFAQKVHFGAQKRKKCKKGDSGAKKSFWSKNRFLGAPGGPMLKTLIFL